MNRILQEEDHRSLEDSIVVLMYIFNKSDMNTLQILTENSLKIVLETLVKQIPFIDPKFKGKILYILNQSMIKGNQDLRNWLKNFDHGLEILLDLQEHSQDVDIVGSVNDIIDFLND